MHHGDDEALMSIIAVSDEDLYRIVSAQLFCFSTRLRYLFSCGCTLR